MEWLDVTIRLVRDLGLPVAMLVALCVALHYWFRRFWSDVVLPIVGRAAAYIETARECHLAAANSLDRAVTALERLSEKL